ncbi:hypothetical protein WJX77_011360 [Trebouxia sp. C0004]
MEASASKNSLLGLHQDLLVKVLLQLEPRDLQSVSCSCKALALTDSPLWQSLFFHKWDVPRGSHLNYKKLYFRREQVLRYLESVCSRLKPEEEPSLQTLHDGRRVVGAGRFAILCPRLVEVVLSAMSVEKTTTTLLKHQVLSLVQLVVYVVYEEAIAMGQATSANLLLITELSEALMWRLAGTAATSAASGGEQHKMHQDSTKLAVVLLQDQQGVGSSASQSEELCVASARLLAAQGMVREGFMTGACRHGPVSGWPSPSSSDGPATASTVKKDKKGKLLKNHTRDIRRDTMGGAGQAEAGLVGRWMAKKSKQNVSASRQMADKLVRLSPKSLLTMFKKTSLQPLPMNSASGPMEGLTGNWLFHNFSAQYFDAKRRPITPFEIIPRAAMGTMHLQVDKSGSVLGTAADVFGGMHIKGTVQKFRHGLWGTQNALARTSTPDLHRQSQTMPKDASKAKPWQLARKSAPQPSVGPSVGSSSAHDECRTSLARVNFKGHVLRIRQRPDALPEYYTVTLEYYGHVTSFGMAGVWFKMQEGVKEPIKEQVGVWAMYPAQRKSAIVNRPASRAETGESGQSSGWNMYEL